MTILVFKNICDLQCMEVEYINTKEYTALAAAKLISKAWMLHAKVQSTHYLFHTSIFENTLVLHQPYPLWCQCGRMG